MGTTSEKLVYLNETKQKIKESINLTNANIVDEPFRQYAVILKNRLPEIVGDPSIIWNNYEHVTGSGTSITISTYKSIFEYSLNGDTTQNGTPTPDAPIPVNTVTGNQTITISNGTNSTVQYINLGKNLFDITQTPYETNSVSYSVSNNVLTQTNTGTYARTGWFVDGLEPNKPYTFKLDFTNSNSCSLQVRIYKSDKATSLGQTSTTTNTSGSLSITITPTEEKCYIRIYSNTTGTSNNNAVEFSNIQLEKGSTATSYAPYFEPIELCKIGTYQDRIYKSNGKWYLHKEIGKVVLNGTETGWMTQPQTGFYRYGANISKATSDSSLSNLIISKSNYFNSISFNNRSTNTNETLYFVTNNLQHQFFINSQTYTTLDDFKTWLGTHNTTIYYVLDTATTEEIKDYDLLNDLNSLELMTGNITITVSGDLPSPIDITAIKN